MVLFVDDATKSQDLIEVMRKASIHNKKEDLFYQRVVYVVYQLNTDPDMELAFGRLQHGDLFLTTVHTNDFVRFKFAHQEFTEANLITFLEDFRQKRLEPFHLSEPDHPADTFLPDSDVLVVTGNQFREKIVQRQHNYILLFCNEKSTCRYAEILFKYVSKLNAFDDILKFAYMNADKNEVKGIKIAKYPSVALFSNGAKNKPRSFDLDLKVGLLSSWLNVLSPHPDLRPRHQVQGHRRRQLLHVLLVAAERERKKPACRSGDCQEREGGRRE